MDWNKDLLTFAKQESWEINKLKGMDVVHYILDNYKSSLPPYVAWHLENAELSGIDCEYDKGWYDALKMIECYFEDEDLMTSIVRSLSSKT
mgnify:CR=1 FL=1